MAYKILMIDDDTELLKMLKKFLEIKKYEIITAEFEQGKNSGKPVFMRLPVFCACKMLAVLRIIHSSFHVLLDIQYVSSFVLLWKVWDILSWSVVDCNNLSFSLFLIHNFHQKEYMTSNH